MSKLLDRISILKLCFHDPKLPKYDHNHYISMNNLFHEDQLKYLSNNVPERNAEYILFQLINQVHVKMCLLVLLKTKRRNYGRKR